MTIDSTTPAPLSSILDGNTFQLADLADLPDDDRELVLRRRLALAPSYRLFYSRPVHAERSAGAYIYDSRGNRILDAYNNVASVGHANPRVIEAVTAQMSRLNTHTRYLQDGVIEYAEQLLTTFPDNLTSVTFTNSGSESNDLAIRVARLWTGGEGLVVTAEAYHGTSDLLSRVSPAASGGSIADPHVRVIPAPDAYRVDTEDIGAWFAARAREAFEDLLASGITPAAFIVDSIFSSDGILPDPAGFLAPAIAVAHEYGALFIADEVQAGFCRTGDTFWGFQRHGVSPDLVSLGKPMGNGIPVSALVGRADVMARFGDHVPYFNTFGGSSVSIAAAQAVLDVIRDEGILESVARVGSRLKAGLATAAQGYDFVGDVRGAGLYIGVEIVIDRASKVPDRARTHSIVNGMRERNVLISVAGPDSNVLKIRPPMVFGDTEVDLFLAEFGAVLAEVAAS